MVTKSTNAALTKDMDNPLYKAKPALTTLPVLFTTGPPPAALSLEGVFIKPPTYEATEQPKGESRPTPSTPAAIGIMITITYTFLEKLV